jgi:hypothetical protein
MAVFTLVERDGKAHSSHVCRCTADSLREVIFARASKKSYLMTDEAPIYQKTGDEFSGHGADQSQWRGIFSRRLLVHKQRRGIPRIAEARGLRAIPSCKRTAPVRYLAEADFKWNYRIALGYDDVDRAAALLRGAKGKRLLYRQPDETVADAKTLN